MIGRILALAIGLFSALSASQLPEFGQQYRQRLGGAIDELRRVSNRFDEDAKAAGLTHEEAIKRLVADADLFVRRRGDAEIEIEARLDRLERQRDDFAKAGSFERLLVLIRDADPGLSRATYLDFEPAWPATNEGLASAGAGFVAGWGGILFLSRIGRRLLFRPRRRADALRSA